MSVAHGKNEIAQHKKRYWAVFWALMLLTLLTVAANYGPFGVVVGIIIGLAIATLKGSLVAAIFMHLIGERKLIYVVLAVTFTFFAVMMIIILGHAHDVPTYVG